MENREIKKTEQNRLYIPALKFAENLRVLGRLPEIMFLLIFLIFKKIKSTNFKNLFSTVGPLSFLIDVLFVVCGMTLMSYITAGNLNKTTI